VASRPHFLAAWSALEPNLTRSFPITFYPLRTQCSYVWNGKIPRRRSGSLPLKSLNSPPSPSLLFQSFLHLLSTVDPFNALSTTTTTRKIPPLREAPPAKVMSCALVASTDLERAFDAAKEVTGGANVPSAKMAGRPANSPGWSDMVCGHLASHDEGWSPPACQGSPCV
jgi:hypothetical protein